MSESLNDRIAGALSQVHSKRAGTDVLHAELVRDIATTTDGRVRLTVLLAPDEDATLVRDVRQALERVAGVKDVRVDVKDPAEARKATPEPAPRRGMLPVIDTKPQSSQPPRVAAPTPKEYPGLGAIIAVSSGKGGVGKSTVAVNLAIALAKAGAKVGIMDADIYGPNVPRMLGVNAPPPVRDNRIQPLEAHGVKVISLGFLIERDQPAIWRGPIVMKVITQFLQDVEWGPLDVLIVDMPPGTGDAQLSLVQAAHVRGAVIVTTPQEVATGDALRGGKMFERVGVPIIGVVENMSWLECPHCGKPTALFGSGGGERLAAELGVPLLGQIPLHPRVMQGGDEGTPIVSAEPNAPAAKALAAIAEKVHAAALAPARA